MKPEDRRQDAFLEHLDESEKRLGATRHSVYDALFVGILTLVIAAGFTLGIMRLRTPSRPEPQSATQSVPAPAASPAFEQDKPAAPPTPPVAQATTDQPRPSTDASTPKTYTIDGSKMRIETHTMSEKERDEKLEQLKKEGLLTDKEVQELKRQQRPR
jgi:hypothetical protein